MPSPLRVPKHPLGVALAAWRLWSRLPPRQRRLLLRAARTHGPRLASRAAAGAGAAALGRIRRR